MTSLTRDVEVIEYVHAILRLLNEMNEAMTAWGIALVLHRPVSANCRSPIALAECVRSLTMPAPCAQLQSDVLHLFQRNAHYLYSLVHHPDQVAAAKREHEEALHTVSVEIMRLTAKYGNAD